MRFCDTLSLEDKFCYEKIRNKFCKYILGLKKIACNILALYYIFADYKQIQ